MASALVIEPFLAIVRRRGFVPFAWYRIAPASRCRGPGGAG
jgi:undecaprenyl pyrophosphate phosphatase UppP